jgi:ubiquinone/menaquinone biosynthesis C-methylase UbiE
MLNLFKTRCHEEELMDLPSTPHREFVQALYDIQWVNNNLGGTAAIQQSLTALIHSSGKMNLSRPLTILDLGTGSADIPRALVDWSRLGKAPPGVRFKITAVDLHPIAVDIAKKLNDEYSEIQVVQADALHIPEPYNAFDFVISSMFMHHLQNDQAVRLLQEMARLCKIGFIVNDLERHPMAWVGIKTLGLLTGKGRIFKNDAPLSVLRGFTQDDLIALKNSAGLTDLEIRRQKPYRWILTWRKHL